VCKRPWDNAGHALLTTGLTRRNPLIQVEGNFWCLCVQSALRSIWLPSEVGDPAAVSRAAANWREVLVETKAEVYEGVITMLARLNPADQPTAAQDLREALAETFGEDGTRRIMVLECLGRYDAICLARVPDLDFGKSARLRDVHGLKKIDFQYGYASRARADAFWAGLMPCEDPKALQPPALMLVSYLRVRDDLTAALGAQLHTRLISQVLGERLAAIPTHLLIRGLGWPDVVVLAASDRLDDLTQLVDGVFWSLTRRAAGAAFSDPTDRGKQEQADTEPVLSRSFTVLGYEKPEALARVEGTVLAPGIALRLRPGAHSAAREALTTALRGWEGKKPAFGFHSRLGADDASVTLVEPNGDNRVDAQKLLKWYRNSFLKDPVKKEPPWRITDLATTSELRLAVEDGRAEVSPLLEQYCQQGYDLSALDEIAKKIDATGLSLAEPVASSLRSLGRMLKWAISNEGIHRDFVDLTLHTQQYCLYMLSLLAQDSVVSAKFLEDVALHTTTAHVAFTQRMAGSYYDLSADGPELVLEYTGGVQKLTACLTALQRACTLGLRQVRPVDAPDAYWVISKSGRPAEYMLRGGAATLSVCSSLAFHPAGGRHAIAHEIAHLLWHLYLLSSQRRSPQEGETVGTGFRLDDTRRTKELLLGEPTLLSAAVYDPATQTWWLERVLKRLRGWLEAGTLPFSRDPWASQYLDAVGSLLNEVAADFISYVVALDGDLERYKRELALLVPRVSEPVSIVFLTWVMEAVAASLRDLGWTVGSGNRLADFLRNSEAGLRVNEYLNATSAAHKPPKLLAPTGIPENRVQALLEQGWQDLKHMKLHIPIVTTCINILLGHVRNLIEDLDVEGKPLRVAMWRLNELGARPGARINPDMLEVLWNVGVRRTAGEVE